MNKLLLSLLAVATLSLATGSFLEAKKDQKKDKVEKETHEYRCGHCKAKKEDPKAACKTQGCPGAHVTCVKREEIVVEEQFEQACQKTVEYTCPEGTKRIDKGPGQAPECEKKIVRSEMVKPCKHVTEECKNACPVGTTMKPGSEHKGNSHNKKHKKDEVVEVIELPKYTEDTTDTDMVLG